jgi:hypothetical protein
MAEAPFECSFEQKRLGGSKAPRVEDPARRLHHGTHVVRGETVVAKHRFERRALRDQAADERRVRGKKHVLARGQTPAERPSGRR